MGAPVAFHRRDFRAGDGDPEIVKFWVDGIQAGNTTQGHRFLAPQPIKVRRLDDYVQNLEKAKVVLDAARRAEIIDRCWKPRLRTGVGTGRGRKIFGRGRRSGGMAGGADGLLRSGLPATPAGSRSAHIRANQKCFVLRDAKTDKLAAKFILVSNMEAADGGKAIIAGNERVIRARLPTRNSFMKPT